MKLVLFLLSFSSTQIFNSKQTDTSQNFFRIPLKRLDNAMVNRKGIFARSRIQLDDMKNIAFGNITVGNPPQAFNVLFDTGSNLLWIFSILYDSKISNSKIVRNSHATYNHSASSTYTPQNLTTMQTTIKYHTGWVTGFESMDKVALGTGYEMKSFLEITNASDHKAYAIYDGILGLKYDPTSHTNLITKFCEKKKLNNLFSYYLPRYQIDGDAYTGELLLCGIDSSKYIAGTLKYHNETDPGKWRISLDSVQLQGNGGIFQVESQSNALLDTGTNRIAMPEASLKKIYQQLNAQPIGNVESQQVDCKTVHLLPSLVFRLGGSNYVLAAKDFIDEVSVDKQRICRILLVKCPAGNWILGDVFLRKYYTVFDMQNSRIGIADGIEF